MPDPNLPTLGDYLAMTPAPRAPQPYQERFLAALQEGSRLETWQERWDRERNESSENFAASIKRIQEAADALVAAFVPIGQAARLAQAAMAPFARQILEVIEVERGPTIGRKRRARRARGRRRRQGNT
jgi:hypothetical protein